MRKRRINKKLRHKIDVWLSLHGLTHFPNLSCRDVRCKFFDISSQRCSIPSDRRLDTDIKINPYTGQKEKVMVCVTWLEDGNQLPPEKK